MKKKVFTGSSFGVAPERTARKNAAEKLVMDVLEQYGYNEVSLPVYEYYEALKDGTHGIKDQDMISFTDSGNGKRMVLRPDFTPQVCRMVAGYKGEFPLPVRVCYRGLVFRNVNIEKGSRTEKYQIGCELYGTKEIYGDLELLLCVNRIMREAKVENFRVVFGDAGYIKRILVLLGERASGYAEILHDKALYKIDAFIADGKYPEKMANLLKKLPIAFGGLKEIEELTEFSAFDKELKVRADYLKEFFEEAVKHGVDAQKIVFDPSEARGLDYYTGINFEVLDTATGASFGGGGRYDTLMRRFNVDYTACGMALYISEIVEASKAGFDNGGADWVVIGNANMAKAEELRSKGHKVVHLFDGDDVDKFLSAVKYNNIFGDK